jgi:metal-responsive CopG/Arc/MetJ family transcriptional regulator
MRKMVSVMTTIQLSIDEPVLTEIDLIIQSLAITRADFVRQALEAALQKHRRRMLEQRDREGYLRHPIEPGEFDVWESEQVWEVE